MAIIYYGIDDSLRYFLEYLGNIVENTYGSEVGHTGCIATFVDWHNGVKLPNCRKRPFQETSSVLGRGAYEYAHPVRTCETIGYEYLSNHPMPHFAHRYLFASIEDPNYSRTEAIRI